MALIHGETIAALKAWVFQDDPSQLTWDILSSVRLEALAVPLLKDRIPEEQRDQGLLKAKEIGLLDMMQFGELCRVERLFAKNSIRCCAFKGADLARRVWPDGALRTRCDLDILVHPQDRKRAISLLEQDGWSTPFRFLTNHHEAPMERHDVKLELHFSMPHMEGGALEEIWESFSPVSPSLYQLPLELNLLMLFTHSRNHQWLNGIQLLLDCGFLVRREGLPDWTTIQAWVERFKTASPALLFRAFPDFFPPESMPEETFPADALNAFREVICSDPVKTEQRQEKVMSVADRGSWQWWMERVRGMRPSVIRYVTNNPRGHYFRLIAGYCQVFCKKVAMFFRFRRGTADSVINSRLQQEEAVERICREQERNLHR